jgi:mannosyl-3-phosphoglycerate synthase
MRIEATSLVEHLGSIRIHGVRRVLELDSGTSITTHLDEVLEAQTIGVNDIEETQQRLAIVLPIKDEDLKVFAGILAGIPHNCLIIVVSNSQRMETDTFQSEQNILRHFCHSTRRQALIVHQKDSFIAQALEQANYTELLGNDGLVRNGKSEGMLLGILLAKLYGKDYVGFIDTDNYIPGAVWEYVKHYAVGFNLAKSPYSMVRILWRYKPKMLGELYFKKWGRVSEITNKCINQFISTKGKFESEIIKTANAGEHAMSIDLAQKLTYATGYGIETQELISIIEQFGGMLPVSVKDVVEKGTEIIQTETINPHLHEERGGEHLMQAMLLPSLSVIYHSQICEESTKQFIYNQLLEHECLKPDEEIPRTMLLPPLQKIDMNKFIGSLQEQLPIFSLPKGEVLPSQVVSTEKGKKIAEKKSVVFTNLEGTLLHPLTDSYTQALDTIRLLQGKRVPIIFCSAKTRSEQQVYREELNINEPFILERGGAIFIPKEYFHLPFTYDRIVQDYLIIELGLPYQEIRRRLKSIQRDTAIKIIGFGDMSVEEIARSTGLNLGLSEFMKQREYSEIIDIKGNKKEIELILKKIDESGLKYTIRGKIYEINSGNNEGKAVQVLTTLFKMNFDNVFTLGIANDESSTAMLAAVDVPMLVQGEGNRWRKIKVNNIKRVKGIGPNGWSKALKELNLGE